MDEIDRAQRQNERAIEAAIARAAMLPQGQGRADCEDCGHEIPAARRAAYPAATRCVYCQTSHEKRMKRS